MRFFLFKKVDFTYQWIVRFREKEKMTPEVRSRNRFSLRCLARFRAKIGHWSLWKFSFKGRLKQPAVSRDQLIIHKLVVRVGVSFKTFLCILANIDSKFSVNSRHFFGSSRCGLASPTEESVFPPAAFYCYFLLFRCGTLPKLHLLVFVIKMAVPMSWEKVSLCQKSDFVFYKLDVRLAFGRVCLKYWLMNSLIYQLCHLVHEESSEAVTTSTG